MSSTFSPIPERPSFPQNEEDMLAFWKSIDAFHESNRRSKGRTPFTFYDGPPFATGLPHYGHILAGTIKDVVTRYAYQRGHDVVRRFGWDCHGLPVEYEIDKKLGVTKRSDVTEDIGIAKYNEECRSIVMTYRKEWGLTVERMGRWIDFENDYKTLDLSYMESVWWVFGELFKKGLVYRDYKVMPFSTACATPLSNFEAGQNYKDVSDPSVVVSFPIVNNADFSGLELLAWTTTPWTLPSNMALCVNPQMEYVTFKVLKMNRTFLVAMSRLPSILKDMKLGIKKMECVLDGSDTSVVEIVQKGILGASLVGLHYEPLFDFYSRSEYWRERAWKVMGDPYVTDDSGTGVVHCAPAFGEDDNRVCMDHGVIEKGGEMPCPVDEYGLFIKPVDEPRLLGVYVKEADKDIKMILKEKGRLLVNDSLVHSYPHCWRSDTPLLYRAVPSWFVKVEAVKEEMLKNNTETNWVPKFVQEKRFHNWLADARDWCVSRSRFWGTPLPLWVSKDFTQIVCVSSVAELQKYTDKPLNDIHRHFIDDITIPDPRGSDYPNLTRVDEVFDCWFESGSMPYAQIHYPFENKERFESSFPADFVAEGLDQTRGWFYTMSILGACLFGKAPFKNLIVNGLVLASDGKKMSKRLQNYAPPSRIFNDYGADALRLFLISSPVVRAESVKFKEESVKEIVKNILLPWFHAFRFLVQEVTRFELNGDGVRWTPLDITKSEHMNVMDRWILSLTHSLCDFVHQEMKAYRLYTACAKLLTLLDQLTNWYVRLNRDRMRGNHKSHECAVSLSVLFEVLLMITSLMAPFTPMTSEYIYQSLRQALPDGHPRKDVSIHFLMLPEPDKALISKELETSVGALQTVVILGRQLRERRKVTIKTPVAKISVILGEAKLAESLLLLEQYIKEELNALEIVSRAEKDCIKLSALPNLKLLGAKYGKDLKTLGPAIKALTHDQLVSLEKGDTLNVMGKDITTEDVLLSRAPTGVVEDDVTGVECNSAFLIVADFAMTNDLIELSLCREVTTRVQKMRKETGLKVEDDVRTILIAGEGSELLEKIFRDRQETIEATLRRKVAFNDIYGIDKDYLLSSREFDVHGETLLVNFYKL